MPNKNGKITKAEVAFELGRVISGVENYRYLDDHASCSYYDRSGQPSCLIGRVMDALEKGHVVRLSDYSLSASGRITAVTGISDHFTDRAVILMSLAQRMQDGGATWGDAVSYALTHEPEISSLDAAEDYPIESFLS